MLGALCGLGKAVDALPAAIDAAYRGLTSGACSNARWDNRAVLKMAVPFDLLTIVRMMPASLPTVRRTLGQPSQRENHVIR